MRILFWRVRQARSPPGRREAAGPSDRGQDFQDAGQPHDVGHHSTVVEEPRALCPLANDWGQSKAAHLFLLNDQVGEHDILSGARRGNVRSLPGNGRSDFGLICEQQHC
jgi:hypothetical protein